MKKVINFLDVFIKSISLIIVLFLVSILLISLTPRTKKKFTLENANDIAEFFGAYNVERVISPNNDERFIVFVNEIERDKLVSLTKTLALKTNQKRLYVTFISKNNENITVIIDDNNDAYIEIKG